jgi:hypothetical protein
MKVNIIRKAIMREWICFSPPEESIFLQEIRRFAYREDITEVEKIAGKCFYEIDCNSVCIFDNWIFWLEPKTASYYLASYFLSVLEDCVESTFNLPSYSSVCIKRYCAGKYFFESITPLLSTGQRRVSKVIIKSILRSNLIGGDEDQDNKLLKWICYYGKKGLFVENRGSQ